MNKQTKTLLIIGVALALAYHFKNRQTKNNYSGNGEVDDQGDYSTMPPSYGGGGGVATGGGGGGSSYVPSGDDDTDSLVNDPSIVYTGNITSDKPNAVKGPGKMPVSRRPLNRPPLVGDKTSGLSGKPVVGMPSVSNRLPMGAPRLVTSR